MIQVFVSDNPLMIDYKQHDVLTVIHNLDSPV